MTIKYTLSEKTVKEHLGSAYNPLRYKMDADYIERKAFKGIRRIYRSDLLDGSLANEAPLETPVEAAIEPEILTQPEVVAKPMQSATSVEQKIVRLYPNKRWVKTDKEDQVFVGLKGLNLKCGQIIRVKNKTLCIR